MSASSSSRVAVRPRVRAMSLAAKDDRNRSSSEIIREEVLGIKERDEENRRCADCKSTGRCTPLQ